MTTEAAGLARTWDMSAAEPVRTVARVHLRPVAGGVRPSKALESALRHVQQTVRADDRVCPFAVSRIAVAFGPDAEAVTARTLGERLARAVTFGMASEAGDANGSSGPRRDRPRPDLDRGRTVARYDHHEMDRATAVVTVDRLVQNGSGGTGTSAPDPAPGVTGGHVGVGTAQLRHRTVVYYPSGRRSVASSRRDDMRPGSRRGGSAGAVLVIDPTPSVAGTAGLAAQAAVATSERIGFRAEAIVPSDDDVLDLAAQAAEIDLVVLMVGTEPAGKPLVWSRSSWCAPAQLAAGYVSLGVDVLAVSAGAGAGALIGCYERGATILFDLDELPAELLARRRHRPSSRPQDASPCRLPEYFEALLQLTVSERRVLFYLTTGKSAQDIADDLVVSLTTVRSHIRSILRKLGVRSQLAAVVIANSRDLGRIQPNVASDHAIAAVPAARRQSC